MKQMYLLLALPLLILMACTQEEPISVQQEESTKSIYKSPRIWGDETLGIDTAAFKGIAQKLIMSNMPISVCEDVHQIIQNSMEAGLTETCYLKEVINDNPKMWIPESTQTKSFFNNLLKFSYTGQSTDSIYITPEILDKVQIYWPYSENWDGVTMPLITWYGERANSTKIYAYIYTNGQRRRIRVDDEYAKDKPVWIINSSIYPHSSFPQIVSQNPNSRLAGDPLQINTYECQMQFVKPENLPQFEGDNGGNDGGGSVINKFITDEEDINLSKGYKIHIGSIKLNKTEDYCLDEAHKTHIYVKVKYVNNNYSIPDDTVTIDIPIHRSELGYTLNKSYRVLSWYPNIQDIAIMICNPTNLENHNYDMSFTGTLSYLDNHIYYTRNFSIPYKSFDRNYLMRTYTKSEFFTNEIIQNKISLGNIEWQFYLEPYTIYQPTFP